MTETQIKAKRKRAHMIMMDDTQLVKLGELAKFSGTSMSGKVRELIEQNHEKLFPKSKA